VWGGGQGGRAGWFLIACTHLWVPEGRSRLWKGRSKYAKQPWQDDEVKVGLLEERRLLVVP
jgi:hypothetical protein